MSRPLEGKLGIITGASRGIGAAIAQNLASKGCNLVINYTSNSSTSLAALLAKQLESSYSIRTLCVQADVGTPDGVRKLVAATKEAFTSPTGTFQIDIIVNNAGIAQNAFIPNVTMQQYEETYRVNVLGPLLLVQAAQPYLPKDRSGRIVNLSSVSSSTGFVGQSVYGGTKAALEAMTRTWARELAENCTVNAINPGPVEGPMYASNSPEFLAGIRGWIMHTPLMAPRPGVDSPEVVEAAKADGSGGRPAYTYEVAGIAGMLCTPDAAWCTGQVVCANGGMLMLH
ncbi:NAD(P)-binding protein [Diplogelasinospora grovesii]|uniref:NAD(P)-binding protein n=1 Tax=Diplogelasinospora grovesii TaxID=303347 RepID=A0AAN6NC03_9PEZI|nr:NAD(P)-binding protein [Diplogelasinospora grovesii]